MQKAHHVSLVFAGTNYISRYIRGTINVIQLDI